MKISRSRLKEIIIEEKRMTLKEGCGGEIEDVEYTPDYDDNLSGMFDDHHSDYEEDSSDNFLTKGEALKSVVAIAMATSCPITREALLDTVQNLMV